MKRTQGRIKVPQNVIELLTLAQNVYQKYLDEGATSKLKMLEGYDWDKIGVTIAPCLASHKLAEDYKAKMETEYRKRDLLLSDIDAIVRASKILLKGIYQKNPKMLGEWHFSVDDSPKSKETPESLSSPELQ